MNKVFKSIATATILTALAVAPVYADGECQPIYGGGQTCVQVGNLILDKRVAKPGINEPKAGSDDFVQSLGQNEAKFAPDSNIIFQITLTNNGGSTINKITVTDKLPEHVTYVSGGNPSGDKRTVTFEETNLKAGETRNLIVRGKTGVASSLPSNAGIVCLVNQAIAKVDNKESQDNAQFCIQKDVVGTTTTKGGKQVFPTPSVVTTPPTGPEALSLMALLPTGALGFMLRKKSIKK